MPSYVTNKKERVRIYIPEKTLEAYRAIIVKYNPPQGFLSRYISSILGERLGDFESLCSQLSNIPEEQEDANSASN